MIGQQFILKKLSLGDIVSMSSVYMTWQLQKLLVVSWVGTGLKWLIALTLALQCFFVTDDSDGSTTCMMQQALDANHF